MKKSTHTIYGAVLRNAHLRNKPVKILPNSTLNQKFGVVPDQLPNGNERPWLQYVGIGLNGVVQEIGVGNLYKTTYREYQPRWGSPLFAFPFIMRAIDDDLTPDERADYRMRKVQTFNGQAYACYYLRKLGDSETKVEYRTVVDGQVIATPWEPSLEDLSPTPLAPNPNQVITTGDDYLAASDVVSIPFTANQIQELLNCSEIMFGDPGYANISELVMVSGLDRTVQGDFNGVQMGYTEAVYAQVNSFLKTMLSAPNQLAGTTLYVDIGANEPLLIVS